MQTFKVFILQRLHYFTWFKYFWHSSFWSHQFYFYLILRPYYFIFTQSISFGVCAIEYVYVCVWVCVYSRTLQIFRLYKLSYFSIIFLIFFPGSIIFTMAGYSNLSLIYDSMLIKYLLYDKKMCQTIQVMFS